MATEQINGIDLSYEIHGAGPPLMLIAGLASDSQSWQPVLGVLGGRHQLILPDNRGVGRTRSGDMEVGISSIAEDCIELIRHLGLSSVNLLGHSMGGFVALEMASRYPEYVGKLILAGTSSSNSRRNDALFADWSLGLRSGMEAETWFRNIFYWIFTARFFEDRTAVEGALRYALEYPYPQSAASFERQVGAIAAYDGSGGLSRIGARTLVIAGEEDLLFPMELCSDLARAIPDATFVSIAGAAHSIHMEQPGAFSRCVLEFLGEC